jgi:hypothetical protein
MWKSRRLSAGFPRGSWEGWKACLWISRLSAAPAFPQLFRLSAFAAAPGFASFALSLAVRLLILLGFLHPVARDIQFDDYAVMHQTVDRGRRHHRVFEDRFPL